MNIQNHSTIKVSPKFWQTQLTSQIIKLTDSKVTNIDGSKIKITSTDCTAEPDIIKWSKQNPDQIIEVKFTGEDYFENLVATYQYLNGSHEFIKEEYEYCFCISARDRDKLDPQLYAKFQQKVTDYFRKIDNYRIRTSENEPSFKDCPIKKENDEEDSLLTPTVEYREGDVTLTAKKFGLTYLNVTVSFREKKSTDNGFIDDFSGDVFDDFDF